MIGLKKKNKERFEKKFAYSETAIAGRNFDCREAIFQKRRKNKEESQCGNFRLDLFYHKVVVFREAKLWDLRIEEKKKLPKLLYGGRKKKREDFLFLSNGVKSSIQFSGGAGGNCTSSARRTEESEKSLVKR